MIGDSTLLAKSDTTPTRQTLGIERQITRGPGGRIISNTGVWSPDGEWIVYDTRSSRGGPDFDGDRIEMVNVRNGEVKELFRSKNGAH